MAEPIIRCKHNNGVGDCPYIRFCLARLADRTITGCGLLLVAYGMIPKSAMMVEHTVKKRRKDG